MGARISGQAAPAGGLGNQPGGRHCGREYGKGEAGAQLREVCRLREPSTKTLRGHGADRSVAMQKLSPQRQALVRWLDRLERVEITLREQATIRVEVVQPRSPDDMDVRPQQVYL